MQASNVATYIAHGDVALSVLMTTASTLGAIIMTPLLTKTLAGTLVPVDAKVTPHLPSANDNAKPRGFCTPCQYEARSLGIALRALWYACAPCACGV